MPTPCPRDRRGNRLCQDAGRARLVRAAAGGDRGRDREPHHRYQVSTHSWSAYTHHTFPRPLLPQLLQRKLPGVSRCGGLLRPRYPHCPGVRSKICPPHLHSALLKAHPCPPSQLLIDSTDDGCSCDWHEVWCCTLPQTLPSQTKPISRPTLRLFPSQTIVSTLSPPKPESPHLRPPYFPSTPCPSSHPAYRLTAASPDSAHCERGAHLLWQLAPPSRQSDSPPSLHLPRR